MTETITLPRKDVEDLRRALLGYIDAMRRHMPDNDPVAEHVFSQWADFSNHITSVLSDHD